VSDLAFRSASELCRALRAREVGCRELLEHYAARVAGVGARLNAVVTLDLERARERADAADAALARGESWGPLHGLPVTLKDTLETAGLRTTAGFPPLADHVPATNAIVAQRLLDAGAVIFGKTNTPLLAGDGQAYNAIFGTTNNPWDPARTPGGSSGGAAAALAAGLTGLEIGSDIGGSIRSPASWCGVYGIKPTHGIIPVRGHIPGMPGALSEPDLAVVGPMARSAADLELALRVCAGPLPEQAPAWRFELPPPRRERLADYRVAAWLDEPAYPVDASVRERLEQTLSALRRAGVRVDERARPPFSMADAIETYYTLLFPIFSAALPPAEFDALARQAAGTDPSDHGPAVLRARATTARHRDWLVANELRNQRRAQLAAFFREFDLLLCPVVPVPAIPHDHSEPMEARVVPVNGAPCRYPDVLFSWIGLATCHFLPAASAPVGQTRGGLPVGVQIVGPYLEDRTVVAFAAKLADVVGGFERPPGF
jgi:amidase